MLTVILNCYKRQEYLREQIDFVNAQSLKPKKIIIWNNGKPLDPEIDFLQGITVINSSENFGVWARFSIVPLAETEYICVMDDDVFPGCNFFKSSLEILAREDCLVGGRGLRFLSHSSYAPFISYGWDSPNESIQDVDIIGHIWLFRRESFVAFWRELPSPEIGRYSGEDMHLSYTFGKFRGLRSIVMPHPESDRTVWSNDPVRGRLVGGSDVAISQSPDASMRFNKAFRYYVKVGFKLVKDHQRNDSPTLRPIVLPLRRLPYLTKLLKRSKRLASIARSLRVMLERYRIRI